MGFGYKLWWWVMRRFWMIFVMTLLDRPWVDIGCFVHGSFRERCFRPWQAVMEAAIRDSGAHGGETRAPSQLLLHQLSCDNDRKVQQFICKTQSPEIFTQSIQECPLSVVWNELTQSHSPVPQSTLAMCSWVCHDVFLVPDMVWRRYMLFTLTGTKVVIIQYSYRTINYWSIISYQCISVYIIINRTVYIPYTASISVWTL